MVKYRARTHRRLATITGAPMDTVRATPAPVGVVSHIGSGVTHVLARCGLVSAATVQPRTAHQRGLLVILCFSVGAISPPMGASVFLLGWFVIQRQASKSNQRTPDVAGVHVLMAVELCAVSVQTGACVADALELIAPHVGGDLGLALDECVATYHDGGSLSVALSKMGDTFGDPVHAFVVILRAVLVDGDPILPALDRLADRLRDEQRHTLERQVRALSVKVLLPLVLCVLPGFVLIGVVPVAVASFRGLRI